MAKHFNKDYLKTPMGKMNKKTLPEPLLLKKGAGTNALLEQNGNGFGQQYAQCKSKSPSRTLFP